MPGTTRRTPEASRSAVSRGSGPSPTDDRKKVEIALSGVPPGEVGNQTERRCLLVHRAVRRQRGESSSRTVQQSGTSPPTVLAHRSRPRSHHGDKSDIGAPIRSGRRFSHGQPSCRTAGRRSPRNWCLRRSGQWKSWNSSKVIVSAITMTTSRGHDLKVFTAMDERQHCAAS